MCFPPGFLDRRVVLVRVGIMDGARICSYKEWKLREMLLAENTDRC